MSEQQIRNTVEIRDPGSVGKEGARISGSRKYQHLHDIARVYNIVIVPVPLKPIITRTRCYNNSDK